MFFKAIAAATTAAGVFSAPAFAQVVYVGGGVGNGQVTFEEGSTEIGTADEAVPQVFAGIEHESGPLLVAAELAFRFPHEGDERVQLTCSVANCGFEEVLHLSTASEGMLVATVRVGIMFGSEGSALYLIGGYAADKISRSYCYFDDGVFASCWDDQQITQGPVIGIGGRMPLTVLDYTPIVRLEYTYSDTETPGSTFTTPTSTSHYAISSPKNYLSLDALFRF